MHHSRSLPSSCPACGQPPPDPNNNPELNRIFPGPSPRRAESDQTNNNRPLYNQRSSDELAAATASAQHANFSMRRMRSRPSNDPGLDQQELGHGAGESSHLLFNRPRQPLMVHGSSSFSGFLPSSLPQRHAELFGLDQAMEIEAEQEQYNDEALNFVASGSVNLQDKRSEICAEFVRQHFKCPICLDVVIESTALTCGHRFCRACINTWFKFKRHCPVCDKRGRQQLPQYDVDNAIDSVANYLSPDWQKRRQFLHEYRQHSSPTIAESTSTIALTWVNEKVEVIFREGSRICRRNGSRLWRSTRESAVRFYENLTFVDVVKGILMGSSAVLLYYVSDDIINFLQYMYIVVSNYDKRLPVMEQIRELGLKTDIEPSKYQDFVGGSDNSYAWFISQWYLN